MARQMLSRNRPSRRLATTIPSIFVLSAPNAVPTADAVSNKAIPKIAEQDAIWWVLMSPGQNAEKAS
jgi:hypothetical protein